MVIPKLERSNRSREYELCHQEKRDKIVYSYLFEGKSHRRLDEEYIGVDLKKSKGWQSMNILHYMGIRGDFKGVFSNVDVQTAISELRNLKDCSYTPIIQGLERYVAYCDNNLDEKAIEYNEPNDVEVQENRNIDKNGLREVDMDSIAKFTREEIDYNSTFDLGKGIEDRKLRTERHNYIVKKFAAVLVENEYRIYEGRIDCLGVKDNSSCIIGEIKTLDGSASDEYNQVIKAFAQLYYYEEFCMDNFKKNKSVKIAIFEKSISEEHIKFLTQNNIEVLWIEESRFEGTCLGSKLINYKYMSLGTL